MKSLLLKAKALKVMLEVAEPKRLRSSEYLRQKVVVTSATTATLGDYHMTIEVVPRGDKLPLVSHYCTCRDHGKAGACKHVLAFAYNKIKTCQMLWDEKKRGDNEN